MLKSGISEGLLPHELLLPVQPEESRDRLADLLLEEDQIVALIPPGQFRSGLVGKIMGTRQPLIGDHWLVIDLARFGPCPLLVNKFYCGEEIIQEGV
jgi:hypothetical protein